MSSISSIFTILEMCVYHLFVTSLHIPCLRFKTKNIKKLIKRYSGIYVKPLLPLLPLMEKKMWTVLFQETAIEKEKKERRGKIQEAGIYTLFLAQFFLKGKKTKIAVPCFDVIMITFVPRNMA